MDGCKIFQKNKKGRRGGGKFEKFEFMVVSYGDQESSPERASGTTLEELSPKGILGRVLTPNWVAR